MYSLYIRKKYRLFLYFICIFILVSCRIKLQKNQKYFSQMEFPCSISKEFKWINKDTFRITSIASPNIKTVGIKRRKQQSSVNSLFCFQKNLRDKFIQYLDKDISLDEKGDFFNGKSIYVYYKNFRIVDSSFDGQQNCKQIFEVWYPNLQEILSKNILPD